VSRAADSERFSGLLLSHRGRTGLTQRDLAARVGVSRRVEQDWEAGVNVPSTEHLQALIQVLFESGGLSAGQEGVEAHSLWAAASGESSARLRRPLDEQWLAGVLAQNTRESSLALPAVKTAEARRQDWARRQTSSASWGERRTARRVVPGW
jgi:transcriptional regulator with XRE-family HTH domain